MKAGPGTEAVAATPAAAPLGAIRPLRGIITHTRPDLDAVLSVWLLRRFGEPRYPGAAACEVRFLPAGESPGGRTPEEWEEEGWLVVDLGGGRLDNHPRSDLGHEGRQDACASTLVARDLGVEAAPDLRKLLKFSAGQDLEGRSIASTDPADHAVALPNIIRGLHLLHPEDDGAVLEVVVHLLDAIHATEVEWATAVREVRKAPAREVAGARLLAVEGTSQALGRAARRKGADLVVQRHAPTGQSAVTLNRRGVLGDWDLRRTALFVRVAEAIAGGEAVVPGDLDRVGMFHGWFLHGSGKILNKGSPKAAQVPSSRLPLPDLLAWVERSLDPRKPLPADLCPPRACAGPACPAHSARLPNCAGQRIRGDRAEQGDRAAYDAALADFRAREEAARRITARAGCVTAPTS